MVLNPGRDLVIKTTIACGVLETVAVILRLIARWRSQSSFAVDDWVLVASLIPSYGMLANGMISMELARRVLTMLTIAVVTKGGSGRHASSLSPSEVQTFLKVCRATRKILAMTDDSRSSPRV